MLREGKVEAITGELGGGKSAEAAKRAFWHLVDGGTVYHNFEFFVNEGDSYGEGATVERCPPGESITARMERLGLKFDPERLVKLQGDSVRDFHRQIKRGSPGNVVMVLLDEAALDYSAEDNKGKKDMEFLAFIVHCRKLEIFLCFITQDAMELEIKIRRRITVETHCRNLKEERFWGLPFPFPMYVTVRFKCYSGRVVRKLDHEWTMRPWAWGMYASKALHGDFGRKFGQMEVAKAGRLERIARKGGHVLVDLAAAAVILLCALP